MVGWLIDYMVWYDMMLSMVGGVEYGAAYYTIYKLILKGAR